MAGAADFPFSICIRTQPAKTATQ